MATRFVGLVVDALDPIRQAAFWAAALRWEADGPVVRPTDATPFPIAFRATDRPKVGKNRVHLDLTTVDLDDQADTVADLVGRGATLLDIGQEADAEHVVLADPEGNELCVIEPTNRFLADCGRLGSITCDGTRANGVFWSELLGWPLVWDQDDETAVRHPDGNRPFITWGPPLPPKPGPARWRLAVEGGDVPPFDADGNEVER